jgi:tetratricopeptide (TPR) repeat protein
LAQFEEACRLSPHDAELQAKAAELLASVGQLSEARVRAEKAVNMDPKLPAAFAARARVSWTSGQLREALADYHRALCFAPEDRRLLQDTATLYQALNEPHRALATLQSLADTYGTGEEPQPLVVQLGDALERTGRFDDAASQYMTALARGPQSADLFYRLARVEDQLSHAGAAERALERAVAMDPNHQPSRDMLGRIQIARQGDSTLRR